VGAYDRDVEDLALCNIRSGRCDAAGRVWDEMALMSWSRHSNSFTAILIRDAGVFFLRVSLNAVRRRCAP
jgi:hypothetical protein